MAKKPFALSLSGVTIAYASTLALCGLMDASDGLDSLNILSWKLSRGSALVQGRVVSVLIAASMDFLIAGLAAATVLLRSPGLTSFLAWAALVNGVFSFVSVIVWYMGVRLSLWASFALAIPMVRVFASLANVQSAGGDGFEGKSYTRIGEMKKDAHVACGSEMKRLGNWSVGMTVGTASLVFSVLCLLLSMRDVAGYWGGRLEVAKGMGANLCLLIHGILVGTGGIAGLLSIMGRWPLSALASVAAIVASLPVSSCISIWWNVLWYRGRAMPGSTFFEANRAIEEQHWYLWLGPLGLFALLQLRKLQKKNLSGFESPNGGDEGEAEPLVDEKP